ncbi:MAG: exodeoxyribonuclease VII large subunit [Dechloromonas sp.]|jgi:exodeoxyribonuclease VII large subunit|nr:exodeoxyribonuclease VII large subunit [Dechloromonas sp.]
MLGTPLPPVLTVSLLNRQVRECLEAGFPLCWVAGEVSNLTYAASGHVYFTLKDATAQVRCVLWRSRAQTLGRRLETGERLEVRALVSFYEPRGEFQLSVEAVRSAGQGELYERFLRLKATLEEEGLFAPAAKRPLPAFPRRLAIVTSPQAAALHDVLSTLTRRAPHLTLTLYPTPVQGDGAAQAIASALRRAGAGGHDLVLLCRGGGSIEDLWAFNEEAVARAIRACPVPVVAGIGHETDFTIADFAADLRAPTPTAAAELAAPDRAALLARVDSLAKLLQRRTERHLAQANQSLDRLAIRLLHPARRIALQRDTLAMAADRLQRSALRRVSEEWMTLAAFKARLTASRPATVVEAERLRSMALRLAGAGRHRLALASGKLKAASAGLSPLNPHAVLSRGYALALDRQGRAIRDAASLQLGERLRLAFARGAAGVVVEELPPGPATR